MNKASDNRVLLLEVSKANLELSMALNLAVEDGDLEAVMTALDAGANPDARWNDDFWFEDNRIKPASYPPGTALHRAVQVRRVLERRSEVGLEIVRTLVARGAHVEARNHWGGTAVQVACSHLDSEAIRVLLELGARHTIPTITGDICLHEALKMAPMRSKFDRDRFVASDEFTRLVEALVATIRVLLDAGADMEALNRDGLTPLEIVPFNAPQSLFDALAQFRK